MIAQSTLFLFVLLILAPLITVIFFSTAPVEDHVYQGSSRCEPDDDYRGSGRVTV